jgi:hypothetical protein
MKIARSSAYLLLLYGVVLHTYTNLFEAESFSFGWWLWSLSPYLIRGLIFLIYKRPHATAGALIIPAILDAGNFYSVFIHPTSSTAALGMLFVPLWNLIIFVPVGTAVGWWLGYRIGLTAGGAPSNTSLERTREG